jgi:hypothetical protein
VSAGSRVGLLHPISGAIFELSPMRNFQYKLVALEQLSGPQDLLILHLVILACKVLSKELYRNKYATLLKMKEKLMWNVKI